MTGRYRLARPAGCTVCAAALSLPQHWEHSLWCLSLEYSPHATLLWHLCINAAHCTCPLSLYVTVSPFVHPCRNGIKDKSLIQGLYSIPIRQAGGLVTINSHCLISDIPSQLYEIEKTNLHRTGEVERDSEDCLVKCPFWKQETVSVVFWVSKDGDSSASLGSLFQCHPHHKKKKKFSLCLNGFSCISVCACCLLSIH